MNAAEAAPATSSFERWLLAGLGLWGVGVQLNEVVATVGLVLTGVVLLARAARERRWPDPRTLALEWWPIWAFIAWGLLAPTVAGRPATPTAAARLLDWAALPVAAAAVAALGVPRRRALAYACGVTLLASCAAAGLQHFGIWPTEEQLAPLAWTKIPFYRVYETVPGDEHRFMAGGLLLHRLKFANVGGLAVLWALALGLGGRGRTRVIGVTVAALGFVSEVAFPYARAASLALVASLGCLLLLQLRDRRKALALGAGLAVVALGVVAASPSLRQRFLASNTGEGGGYRPYFLAAGMRAVETHPLAGVGPGRFRPSLFAVPGTPEYVLEHRGKTHNQFVTLAAEMGVPGAVLFAVMLVLIWRRLRGNSAADVAGRACLVFFVLVSALHDPLFHPESSMAIVLALGAAIGAGEAREGGATNP